MLTGFEKINNYNTYVYLHIYIGFPIAISLWLRIELRFRGPSESEQRYHFRRIEKYKYPSRSSCAQRSSHCLFYIFYTLDKSACLFHTR